MIRQINIKQLFIIFLIIFHCSDVLTQNIMQSQDLSQVNIESLTESQISQIKSELIQNNTTIEAVEPMLMSKGLSAINYSLLKDKIKIDKPKTNVEGGTNIPINPIALDQESNKKSKTFDSKIFGSEIFSKSTLSFEPNSNMPTPVNYILGVGDELQIIIHGIQEFSTTSTVNKEGKINITNIGQLSVSGMTLEVASSYIKKSCSKVYSTLLSGQSNISITISKIKTIKVSIIGSKNSGNYSLSSLSTVFNALYISGGPDENGSYRNIELIRDNKVIKTIDIYKFLVSGDQSENSSLKDNDIIRIPVYKCRVSIEGQVKNPGIFELKPTENFNDLLKYCSGFRESAYTATIKLIQNTDKELKIVDLKNSEYMQFIPKTGDVFKVGILLNRFENKLTVRGAVFRPDDYSLTDGLRVKDLIEKADGLIEDAYKQKAQLTRLQDDFTKKIISINLFKVLEGDSSDNILLKKDDELLVFSVFDFKQDKSVTIQGQIRKPGSYNYFENLKLFDLILQAGGFTDIASKQIEISRIIKKDEVNKDQQELTEIITVELTDLSNISTQENLDILLEPYDVIQIRKIPIYVKQETVLVTGQVEFPGEYSIKRIDEKVLDIINRSGGIKLDANSEGIYIIRDEFKIPINYDKIIKKPNSIQNIRPLPGDEIRVLKYNPSIRIIGGVVMNSEIPYITGKGTHYFINSAGGINENGWRKKIYVTYPNGLAKHTKQFLFFRSYPKIEAGSTIHIPIKPERKKNTTEIFGIASITTSMATMIAIVARMFN